MLKKNLKYIFSFFCVIIISMVLTNCGGGGGGSSSSGNNDNEIYTTNNIGEDGIYSTIKMAPQNENLVLEFLNHYSSNRDVFQYDVGLTETQSRELLKYKKGKDGIYGTIDDEKIDTIQELDEVLYIGQKASNKLDNFVTNWNSKKIPKYHYALNYLNHRTIDYDKLKKFGIYSDAPKAIEMYRGGSDKIVSTEDDNYFDNIKELKNIDGVGKFTLNQILMNCDSKPVQGVESIYDAEVKYKKDKQFLKGEFNFKAKLILKNNINRMNIKVSSNIILKCNNIELLDNSLFWKTGNKKDEKDKNKNNKKKKKDKDDDSENSYYDDEKNDERKMEWKLSKKPKNIKKAKIKWLSDTFAVLEMKIKFEDLLLDKVDTFSQIWDIKFQLGNNPFVIFDRIGDDEYWKQKTDDEDDDGYEDESDEEEDEQKWVYKKIGNFPYANDFDNDGLADNIEEPDMNADLGDTETDRFAMDSDNDGLSDYNEIFVFGTNSRSHDSDRDLLSDSAEILLFKTNPLMKDSDGDSIHDGYEIKYGLNPLNKDSNNNGILDTNEDEDNDGRSNLKEFFVYTDPLKADKDSDGLLAFLILKEINYYDKKRTKFISSSTKYAPKFASSNQESSARILVGASYTYYIETTMAVNGKTIITRVYFTDVGPVNDKADINIYGSFLSKYSEGSGTSELWGEILIDDTSDAIVKVLCHKKNTNATPGFDARIRILTRDHPHITNFHIKDVAIGTDFSIRTNYDWDADFLDISKLKNGSTGENLSDEGSFGCFGDWTYGSSGDLPFEAKPTAGTLNDKNNMGNDIIDSVIDHATSHSPKEYETYSNSDRLQAFYWKCGDGDLNYQIMSDYYYIIRDIVFESNRAKIRIKKHGEFVKRLLPQI